MVKFRALLLTMMCLALFGGRGLHAQSSYREKVVANGGTIRGEVRLTGEIPRSLQLTVSKDANYCGPNKSSPRLRVGKSKGVQNAIVWLEGVSEGKKPKQSSKQLVLNQHKCEYNPHILLLPFGSTLDIVNSDPILHNVHAYDDGDNARTLFNIAQPIKGQRTTVKQTQFKKSGLYLATCDAGHPWMNAYIMVTDHPYYALTDANGAFVLDNVPPGKYKLKMWHEGVAVAKAEMDGGKVKTYKYEEPYEEAKDVSVAASGTSTVEFSFILRTAPPDVTVGSNSIIRQ